MIRNYLVVCSGLLLGTANSLSAQVILSNYPPSNDTNATAEVDNLRNKALSVSVPVGQDLLVGDITVRLGNYAQATDIAILQIREHTGSTTAPSTNVLYQFIAPPVGTAAIQDFTFTASTPFTLLGGTSYWLVMSGGDAATSFDWRGSSPPITPTGLAMYGGQSLFTTNAGGFWTASATINSLNWAVGIPEPISLVLASVGIAGAWWLRRRRK